jgi:hypothetical protein
MAFADDVISEIDLGDVIFENCSLSRGESAGHSSIGAVADK